MSLSSKQDAVQRDGPFGVRAGDSDPCGFARVTVDALSRFPDRQLKVLLALELLARGKDVCRASNDDICRCTGKGETAVEETLRALEQAGHIERLYLDPDRCHRSGIRLLTRCFNPAVFRARAFRVRAPGNPCPEPQASPRISVPLSLDVQRIDSKTCNAISPTAEEPAPPAADAPQAGAPSAEACQLHQDLTARGIRFQLKGAMVQMQRAPGAEPPTAEELEQLRRLKPEIMALIAQPEQPVAAPAQQATPPRRAFAPAFRNPHRIRVLMGLLGPGAGDAACEEVAAALVAECRDRDAELSRRTYRGIARDVCRGRISQADIQTSFEIACGPGIFHRGRAFIAEVSRRRQRARGRQHPIAGRRPGQRAENATGRLRLEE